MENIEEENILIDTPIEYHDEPKEDVTIDLESPQDILIDEIDEEGKEQIDLLSEGTLENEDKSIDLQMDEENDIEEVEDLEVDAAEDQDEVLDNASEHDADEKEQIDDQVIIGLVSDEGESPLEYVSPQKEQDDNNFTEEVEIVREDQTDEEEELNENLEPDKEEEAEETQLEPVTENTSPQVIEASEKIAPEEGTEENKAEIGDVENRQSLASNEQTEDKAVTSKQREDFDENAEQNQAENSQEKPLSQGDNILDPLDAADANLGGGEDETGTEHIQTAGNERDDEELQSHALEGEDKPLAKEEDKQDDVEAPENVDEVDEHEQERIEELEDYEDEDSISNSSNYMEYCPLPIILQTPVFPYLLCPISPDDYAKLPSDYESVINLFDETSIMSSVLTDVFARIRETFREHGNPFEEDEELVLTFKDFGDTSIEETNIFAQTLFLTDIIEMFNILVKTLPDEEKPDCLCLLLSSRKSFKSQMEKLYSLKSAATDPASTNKNISETEGVIFGGNSQEYEFSEEEISELNKAISSEEEEDGDGELSVHEEENGGNEEEEVSLATKRSIDEVESPDTTAQENGANTKKQK